MLVAVAALSGVSIIIYNLQTTEVDRLSSELEEKSLQIDQQGRQIDEYTTLVSTQQLELADKTDKLEALQSEIGTLFREIALQEQQLASRAVQTERLKADLDLLQEEAASLEQEIALLQSEIQAKDQNITELLLASESDERVHVTHYGLGVTEDGAGVVFPIEVEIIESGEGRIFVDVSNVEYAGVFQEAVRTAAEVASSYSDVPVTDKDIVVRLINNFDELIIVDGPSAGAVIAVMMVAGLEEEKSLDPDVLVTGSIESDGRIGVVGHISGKADAAADFGAKTLLVPEMQEFNHGKIEVEGVRDIEELAGRIVVVR